MRRLLSWLRGCQHDWRNTGDSYTDPNLGFTVVVKQCSRCSMILIAEV